MKNKISQFVILSCCLIIIAWGLLFAPGPAHCQDATKFTIRTYVVDTGGGVVRSENYRLHFSLGQPLHGGESVGAGKTMSAGFVHSTAKMAKEGQSTPGDGVYGSGGGGSCFIGTLSENPSMIDPETAGNGG
jgi:hypothetical protein